MEGLVRPAEALATACDTCGDGLRCFTEGGRQLLVFEWLAGPNCLLGERGVGARTQVDLLFLPLLAFSVSCLDWRR